MALCGLNTAVILWNPMQIFQIFIQGWSYKPTFEHHFSQISLSLLTPVIAPVLCLESMNIWGFCTAAQSVCVTVFTHCTEIHTTVIMLQLIHCEWPSLSHSLFSWVFIFRKFTKVWLAGCPCKSNESHWFSLSLPKPIHVEILCTLCMIAVHYCRFILFNP